MLSELLSNYGPIYRIWFDNYMLDTAVYQPYAVPGFTGAALADTWAAIVGHVKMLSPNTLMIPGPDGCLNPGEAGGGIYPVWNYQRGPTVYWGCGTAAPPPNTAGFFAAPRESDFSVLNPGDYWFWDAADPVLSPEELWSSYTDTVGRGSQYILNVPPDRSGAVPASAATAAAGLGEIINYTYGSTVAAVAPQALPAPAPCAAYVVELELPGGGVPWDEVVSQELLAPEVPQLIASYRLDAHYPNGSWALLTGEGFHGATVGARLVDWGFLSSAAAGATTVRFTCTASLDASANVSLTSFAVYDGTRCWPNTTLPLHH